jgi:hypothetical protein
MAPLEREIVEMSDSWVEKQIIGFVLKVGDARVWILSWEAKGILGSVRGLGN